MDFGVSGFSAESFRASRNVKQEKFRGTRFSGVVLVEGLSLKGTTMETIGVAPQCSRRRCRRPLDRGESRRHGEGLAGASFGDFGFRVWNVMELKLYTIYNYSLYHTYNHIYIYTHFFYSFMYHIYIYIYTRKQTHTHIHTFSLSLTHSRHVRACMHARTHTHTHKGSKRSCLKMS